MFKVKQEGRDSSSCSGWEARVRWAWSQVRKGQIHLLVLWVVEFVCFCFCFLDGEVARSRPAACSTGFTEPAPGAVAVGVRPQVTSILALKFARHLPPGRVAAQLEQVHLLHCGSYFVLLRGHVLWVLLVGQAVGREGHRQEVSGAHHTLGEVWKRGWRRWRRQRELLGQRGFSWSDGLPRVVHLPTTQSLKPFSWKTWNKFTIKISLRRHSVRILLCSCRTQKSDSNSWWNSLWPGCLLLPAS